MSNSYINIRFGHHHFQVTYDPLKFSWSKNDYWLTNKPTKWFEIYEFFWYKGY